MIFSLFCGKCKKNRKMFGGVKCFYYICTKVILLNNFTYFFVMNIQILDLETFPTHVSLPEDIDEEKKKINEALATANQAVKTLTELGEVLTPTTRNIDEWQGVITAINERKEQAISAIYRNKIITYYDKKKTVKQWQQWAEDATNAVTAIIYFLGDYPSATLTLDGGFSLPDIQQIASARVVKDVPPEARKHAQLIADVATAITALRKWESQRNLVKIPLTQLMGTPAERLAQMWAAGREKRQTPTTPLMRQIMEEAAAKEPFYL